MLLFSWCSFWFCFHLCSHPPPWPDPPRCCPDRCLHGLCSLAASCTQMYCPVSVNRLKIPWCCPSEFREAGKEAGVRRPRGSGRHTEAQSHGMDPSGERAWRTEGQPQHRCALPCPVPEPAGPAPLTLVLMVCKCARCDVEHSRALCSSFGDGFLSFLLNFCAKCCDAGSSVLQSAGFSRHCHSSQLG